MQGSEAAKPRGADFVHEEYLKLGDQQNSRVLWGVMFASAMLAAIAAFRMGPVQPLVWLVLIAGTQWLRVRIESGVADAATGTLAERMRMRIGIAALCGAAQALAVVAFPVLDVAERAFFTIVMIGLATGAVANTAGHMRTLVAYGAPMLLPLAALWAVLGVPSGAPWLGPAMAVLLAFYAAVLHGFAQSAWRIFEESCLIRFKDIELNERLTVALAAAESANRAKTRFLAAASHDLRQPLHTMVLLTSALSLRALDRRSLEIVNLLGEVTDTISAQLDDLLDISKLDAGVMDVHLETLAAGELLAQHFAEVESVIRAKGLEPRLSNACAAFVAVDPQLFGRILRNLTHNAIKFTERGHVALEAREDGDQVVIAIRDTGCGIAAEHREEVFLEFFQASNPERDRSKGLGLGLSIVQRLCRLLRIGIEMRSAPGQGTVFELRLPRVAAPVAAQECLAGDSDPSRSYGLHVLVIDDEKSVRTGMRLLLEELGCACSEATSTAQACELALDTRPDLVLADFRLRGEDSGLKALAALDAVLGGVPGLLVSGDTAPERLREARAAGRQLLHKPLSLDELQLQLQAAAEARQKRTEGMHGRQAGAVIAGG